MAHTAEHRVSALALQSCFYSDHVRFGVVAVLQTLLVSFCLFVCFPGNRHCGEVTSVAQQVYWDHRSKPCKSMNGREEMQGM